MNLRQLIEDPTAPDIILAGLSEHDLEVCEGYGFVATAANDEGFQAHCRAAVAAGAVAILTPPRSLRGIADLPVPVVQVPGLAQRRGELAAKFYGDPSRRMVCVGITGTNGKTSCAFHFADLSSRLGCAAGYSGTLGWGSLNSLQHAATTTSNAVALQRQLRTMLDAGCQRVALEISSHALHQGRAHAVSLQFGVFTNISRDHLDYHGSERAYADAKRRLFTDFDLRAAIINTDDAVGAQLAEEVSCPVIRYGRQGDWCWRSTPFAGGLKVHWETPAGPLQARLPVLADYAVANVTAALAVLLQLGHSLEALSDALAGMQQVPGRMEMIAVDDAGPRVIVDYAHTPDALAKVLDAVRPFVSGRLLCVFGCGGDRDVGKRPQMAAAATERADVVWLTSDNPRSEDPAAIIDDMCRGLASKPAQVHVCVMRDEAIRAAIEAAGSEDTVVIAGKGHEDYQEIAGVREPFDDRLVAAAALRGVR